MAGVGQLSDDLPRWSSTGVLLLARLWVASVFITSGWLKLTAWDSTLYLFESEYQVPLLPWLWAAYLGTAAELLLPLFLLAGLFTSGRLAAVWLQYHGGDLLSDPLARRLLRSSAVGMDAADPDHLGRRCAEHGSLADTSQPLIYQ